MRNEEEEKDVLDIVVEEGEIIGEFVNEEDVDEQEGEEEMGDGG